MVIMEFFIIVIHTIQAANGVLSPHLQQLQSKMATKALKNDQLGPGYWALRTTFVKNVFN